MTRRLWWIGGGVILVGGGVLALTLMHSPTRSFVPSALAHSGRLDLTVPASGSVTDPNQVQVSPNASGQLATLTVQVGQRVAAGAVLGSISSQSTAATAAQSNAQVQNAQAALAASQANLAHVTAVPSSAQVALDKSHVAQAKASLQSAQVAYTDAQKVYNAEAPITTDYKGMTSLKQALDQAAQSVTVAQTNYNAAVAQMQSDEAAPQSSLVAQAQDQVNQAAASLRAAEAQSQSSQASLANTTITAPVSGVVTVVTGAVGQQVGSATTLLTILPQPMQLQAVVDVPEVQVAQVAAGQSVSLSTNDLSGQVFAGKVTYVSQTPVTLNNVTDYPVYIQISGSTGHLLPGMSINANIVTGTSGPGILIPALSLMTIRGRTGVFVRKGKGYRFHPVQVIAQGSTTVAVQGIPDGSRVALLNPFQARQALGGGGGPGGGGPGGGGGQGGGGGRGGAFGG